MDKAPQRIWTVKMTSDDVCFLKFKTGEDPERCVTEESQKILS